MDYVRNLPADPIFYNYAKRDQVILSPACFTQRKEEFACDSAVMFNCLLASGRHRANVTFIKAKRDFVGVVLFNEPK